MNMLAIKRIVYLTFFVWHGVATAEVAAPMATMPRLLGAIESVASNTANAMTWRNSLIQTFAPPALARTTTVPAHALPLPTLPVAGAASVSRTSLEASALPLPRTDTSLTNATHQLASRFADMTRLPTASCGDFERPAWPIVLPGSSAAIHRIIPDFALPSPGLTPEAARNIRVGTVYAGLTDGSLNPRNPEWRPDLVFLLTRQETRNPDSIFSLLLAGCAGNTDEARVALAEKWAKTHEEGHFSGAIAYFAARYFFFSAQYREAIRRAQSVHKTYPEFAVKALLVEALAEANAGNPKKARAILDDIQKHHPDSPEIPEVHYMTAWLALQDMHDREALEILRRIVADYPHTPAAQKAAQMIETLEGVE